MSAVADLDFLLPTEQEMTYLRARLFALRVAAANVEESLQYEDSDNTASVTELKRQWSEVLAHWVEDARTLAYGPLAIAI